MPSPPLGGRGQGHPCSSLPPPTYQRTAGFLGRIFSAPRSLPPPASTVDYPGHAAIVAASPPPTRTIPLLSLPFRESRSPSPPVAVHFWLFFLPRIPASEQSPTCTLYQASSRLLVTIKLLPISNILPLWARKYHFLFPLIFSYTYLSLDLRQILMSRPVNKPVV